MTSNTKIETDIKVGKDLAIVIDFNYNPNSSIEHIQYMLPICFDNTVSVIDGTNNTKIGDDIKVGKTPFAIGVNLYKYNICCQ